MEEPFKFSVEITPEMRQRMGEEHWSKFIHLVGQCLCIASLGMTPEQQKELARAIASDENLRSLFGRS